MSTIGVLSLEVNAPLPQTGFAEAAIAHLPAGGAQRR